MFKKNAMQLKHVNYTFNSLEYILGKRKQTVRYMEVISTSMFLVVPKIFRIEHRALKLITSVNTESYYL